MSEYKIYSLHMCKAKCAVDLGDGSERGEYVNQDYILNKMGRPHRSISLMYCYYPLDKEFPGRISEVMKDADISFAWDYPYDDYFTYKGGLEGNTEGEPFTCMRDVRRHGQEVTLTLTVDPHVSDEQLIAIANDLRPFGRLLLRINHEATGNWFSGFTFYQFRDRGRLGLEIQDPNYADCGIEQPVMKTYKEIIHDDFFKPAMTRGDEITLPCTLRWGGSEDAEGLEIPLHFEKNPHFCEVTFDDDSNIMMEINGKWFYKSPEARTIDLMAAFFEKPLEGEADLTLRLFAPPASGENDLSIEDGLMNSYTEIKKLPNIRIRFEPVEL